MRKFQLNLALSVAIVAAVAAVAVADEAQLIAVLKSSDATVEQKSSACRELTRIATKQSVPVLAGMLADEHLGQMARNALEPLPDPSVDVVLRDALGKLKGRPLLGVIGSLGVRHDTQAIDALGKLLADPDTVVAQAAARALGNIGTAEAAKAIQGALAGTTSSKQVDFCEGILRCAEALSAKGNSVQAQAVYDQLRTVTPAPHQVRAAALRGAILTRGKDGVPLLIEAIRSADYTQTAAAARTALEMPCAEVTAALAAELPKLPADKQILVLNTLGYRGDASAGPAMLALAKDAPPEVRLAAVQNVTHLGYAAALPLLAQLSLTGEGQLAGVARDCLGSFPGKDADATVMSMIGDQDATVRRLAVEMIGLRNITQAAGVLLKAADDADESVRTAALRSLRDRAGMAELPPLLGLLVKGRSSGEIKAAEDAVIALCARQSEPVAGNIVIVKAEYGALPEGPSADVTQKVAELIKQGARSVEGSNENFGDPANGTVKKFRVDYTVNGVAISKTVGEREPIAFTAVATDPAVVDAICAAIDGAQGEAKLALLRTLRAAGGPKALGVVKSAAGDSDAQVRETALRTLCDWPTTDALPMVAELLKSPPNKTLKILALRGFVRLVPQQIAPDAAKLQSLKDAMAQAERNEEKRLVLSALGNVPTAEALSLVAASLDNDALKEEACLAAVMIAEKLPAAGEVTEVMRKVAKQTVNKKLAGRANALVRKAKK